MANDPAALFFTDKWLLATAEMKADCKAWYLELILQQFDKKSLPNDIEELAHLARVRISEFEHFKQVFEEVLKHKFKETENGRLVNNFAEEVIKNREVFKEKRSNAGKMSYFAKYMRKFCKDENVIRFVLQHTDFDTLDTKNEQILEQVFKQTSELYINVNVNADVIVNTDTTNYIDYETMFDNTNSIIVEKQKKLYNDILKFFGYDNIHALPQKELAFGMVYSLPHHDRLDYAIEQITAYFELKGLDGFKHDLKNFLGKQDQQFSKGFWNDNWVLKLSDYKKQQDGKTNKQNSEPRRNPNPKRGRSFD